MNEVQQKTYHSKNKNQLDNTALYVCITVFGLHTYNFVLIIPFVNLIQKIWKQ